MGDGVIIHSENFKYPTLKERTDIQENIPDIIRFTFKESSKGGELLDKNLWEKIAIQKNLIEWNRCLCNRLSLMEESFTIALTNYNRGFPEDYKFLTEIEFINHWKFDTYVESFYYYFFSSRDIIAQILNVYFQLYIPEDKLYLNKKFIKIIPCLRVKSAICSYLRSTITASRFRNTFTHKFTLTQPDYRVDYLIENGKRSLQFKGGEYIKATEFLENMCESLKSLSAFMSELTDNIKIEDITYKEKLFNIQ